MRKNNDQRINEARRCKITFGSMTQAMRAQVTLEHAAIRAEVIRLDSAERGCGYAILLDCLQEGNARAVLRAAGIRSRR